MFSFAWKITNKHRTRARAPLLKNRLLKALCVKLAPTNSSSKLHKPPNIQAPALRVCTPQAYKSVQTYGHDCTVNSRRARLEFNQNILASHTPTQFRRNNRPPPRKHNTLAFQPWVLHLLPHRNRRILGSRLCPSYTHTQTSFGQPIYTNGVAGPSFDSAGPLQSLGRSGHSSRGER